MANNDLVIQQAGDELHILGALDVDHSHKKIAGTSNQQWNGKLHLMLKAADTSEKAISAAVSLAMAWGKLVDDKHVKFASPIVITGITKDAFGPIAMQAKMKRDFQTKQKQSKGGDIMLSDPRIQRLFEPQSEPDEGNRIDNTSSHITSRNVETKPSTTKLGSANVVTITYEPAEGVYEVLDLLQAAIKHAVTIADSSNPEMVKEARSYTNTPFFEAMADARVDGNEIGLSLPIKIEFGNERLKEAFLLMGKRREPLKEDAARYIQHKDAQAKVVTALSKSATCRMPVSLLLARARRSMGAGWRS